MAAFEQRKSGYWQAKIRRDGWPNQSKTFRTKGDAEMWARQVETEMDRGAFVSRAAAERTTIADLAARFREPGGYAEQHYRGAAWRHKLDHLVQRLGEYSLAAITPDLINKYRDQRLRDPDPRYKDHAAAPRVSGATVKTELDLLSKLLTVAERQYGIHLVGGNMVRAIQKPRANPPRDLRFSQDDWAALEQACKKSRNHLLHPALVVAVETAMRQGEMLAMRWEDVDVKRRTVRLPMTKNGESRLVPLTSRALEVILALPRDISGRVLALEKQTLYSAFKAAVGRAGLREDYTWHTLRHEAMSRLAERGDLSVFELAAISGHKTLQMVHKYAHMTASTLAQKLG